MGLSPQRGRPGDGLAGSGRGAVPAPKLSREVLEPRIARIAGRALRARDTTSAVGRLVHAAAAEVAAGGYPPAGGPDGLARQVARRVCTLLMSQFPKRHQAGTAAETFPG